jgi:predicted Holliday junction resolvase-like endonuclease
VGAFVFSRFIPHIAIAAIVVVLVLGMQWKIRSLQRALESAETKILTTGSERDQAKLARDMALAANNGLVARLATQNQAIASLAAAGQAKDKAAQAASKAVLARKAPVVDGHGPAVMNEFIRRVFDAP